jgi:hypothetical protein
MQDRMPCSAQRSVDLRDGSERLLSGRRFGIVTVWSWPLWRALHNGQNRALTVPKWLPRSGRSQLPVSQEVGRTHPPPRLGASYHCLL